MAEGAPRYHFGPLERRGLILGLRAGQGLVLLVAGFIFVLCLHSLPGVSAGVVGFAVLLAAAAAAFLPVSGRTLEQWAPVALRWSGRRLTRQDRHFSTAPLRGHDGVSGEPPAPALPAFLQGVSIIPAPLTQGGTAQIGVLKDDREKTFTAVLTVRGQSFALLDPSEKARILEGWGSVLAALSREGSLISRVQWIERTFPEGGDAMGSYLREAVSLPVASTPVRSYLELVENAGPATQHHETLVTLQLDARRAHRAIKQAGGRDPGACAVLAREIAFLASQLSRVGILVDGVLTPRLLAKAIRVAFDPQSRAGLARRAVDDSALAGVHPNNAWPIATVASWGGLRTDSAVSATYWIREWPRVDVGPDFLAPFLLQTRAQRSVSLVMEPVP
ncbi:MAG: SCO6880 family protein, partial [Candidatus Dormibacteria bacterium]